MKFADLGLSPETLQAIAERGYETPTPIQEKAIPAILMARDVVGLAQTGTGKTAGFTLPMIEALSGGRARMRMPRSLVLEPTRELAAQVAENFEVYGKYHKLTKALLVGGESMGDQMKLLERGVDVLIATPGRLLDLFERGAILLNDIRILVIDEADRMMDMGFIPDIERIVSLLPPNRQTLLFSATMPPEIKKLADRFLSNPKEVSVSAPATTATTVKQMLVMTHPKKKRETLDRLLKSEDVKNAFIFLNRKRDIAQLADWLKHKGYKVGPMHGDMPQVKRNEVLQAFKDGQITLLVCSDVAARGLDVQGVSHVFNFDVPMHADDYVHRIGRTGRAGREGRAWMLGTNDEQKYIDAIERLTKKPIERAEVQGAAASEGDGGGNSRSEGRPPREDRPRREDRPQKSARPDRPERGERPDNRPPRHRGRPDHVPGERRPLDHADDDRDVVGFGDDIPGFLR